MFGRWFSGIAVFHENYVVDREIDRDSGIDAFVNQTALLVVIGLAPKLQRFSFKGFNVYSNNFQISTVQAVPVPSTTPMLDFSKIAY